MRFLSTSVLSSLSIFAMVAAVMHPTVASARSANQMASRNMPVCYVQFSGQAMRSLDRLCGVGQQTSNLIDLSVDQNGDGVPDQLLALMQLHRTALNNAQTEVDYQVAQEKLEARLPYSNQVKQMQAQQRKLREQLQNAPRSQRQDIYRQIGSLYEKIAKDPSYKQVQQAMIKVYRALN